MLKNTDFHISLPMEKSERSDGWYLVGLAAGVDPDLENDAMSPRAIEMSARQINASPLPFYDWHNKNSVLSELGEVTKAWVDDKFNLGVEVKLDEDSSAAETIWKKIKKGKQYGMSIHGKGLSYQNEVSKAGQTIRRIDSVLLDEISITTRPVWTPSFGTVLSKAIDQAEKTVSVVTGENSPMAEETLVKAGDETTVVAVTTDSTPTTTEETAAPAVSEPAVVEKAADETVTVTPEAVTTDTTVPQTPETEPVEVEKAVEKVALTPEQLSQIVVMHKAQAAWLAELGLLGGAVTATTDKPVEQTVEKSEKSVETAQVVDDTSSKAEIAELRKALDALLERIPEKNAPGVLIRKSEAEELAETLETLQTNPRAALRFGLAGLHDEGDKFRG